MVLIFERMTIPVANVQTDGETAIGPILADQLRHSGGGILGVRLRQMKKRIVSGTQESEQRLVPEMARCVLVLKFPVEGGAKGPRGGGCRHQQMTGMVRAWNAMVRRRGQT